jgi:hypothetical protein
VMDERSKTRPRFDPALFLETSAKGRVIFSARSTALRIGDKYWFGTAYGDSIATSPAN